MKNKRIALFVAAVLILLIMVGIRGDHFSQFKQLFANENISNNEILLDHEIEELIYFYQHVMKKSNKEATRTAIDTLLKDKAIQQEAEKQKLHVNEKEVQKTIDFQIKNAKLIDSPELTSLLEGLDLTIEEYYQEYAYEKIRGKLMESKLFEVVTKDIQDPDEKVKLWDKEKQKLEKQFMTVNYVEIEQLKKRYQY
jgi:hypothetical protein